MPNKIYDINSTHYYLKREIDYFSVLLWLKKGKYAFGDTYVRIEAKTILNRSIEKVTNGDNVIISSSYLAHKKLDIRNCAHKYIIK